MENIINTVYNTFYQKTRCVSNREKLIVSITTIIFLISIITLLALALSFF